MEEGVYTTECPELFVKPEVEKYLLWKRWRTLGAPFAGGWMDWPAVAVDIIETLEGEYDKWIEEKQKSGGKR